MKFFGAGLAIGAIAGLLTLPASAQTRGNYLDGNVVGSIVLKDVRTSSAASYEIAQSNLYYAVKSRANRACRESYGGGAFADMPKSWRSPQPYTHTRVDRNDRRIELMVIGTVIRCVDIYARR